MSIESFRIPTENGWTAFAVDNFETKEQCDIAIKECNQLIKQERSAVRTLALKGILKVGLSIGIAYLAAQAVAVLAGIILIPLAIIPPVYAIALIAVKIVATAVVGYYIVPKIWTRAMQPAEKHRMYENHLREEVTNLQLRITQFTASIGERAAS